MAKMAKNEFYCVACRKRVKPPKESIKKQKDVRGRSRLVAKDKEGHKLYKYISEN